MNHEGLSSPDFQFDFLLVIYVGISHMAGTPRSGGSCSPLQAAIARCTYMWEISVTQYTNKEDDKNENHRFSSPCVRSILIHFMCDIEDRRSLASLLRTQRGVYAALGPPSTTTHTRISLRQACAKCDCDAPGTKVCPGNNLVKNDVLMMFVGLVCEL